MVNRRSNTSIQVRLPQELKERFDTLTEAQGVNKSELIRQLIEQYCSETGTRGRQVPAPLRQLYTKIED